MTNSNTGGRAWCEHIIYVRVRGWTMFDYSNKYYLNAIVAGDWKLCPICGKPKPAEKHRREGKDEH